MRSRVHAALAAVVAILIGCGPQVRPPRPTPQPVPAAAVERDCPPVPSGRDACRPDVLVVGGGLAGVAAAVSAARHGLHATLLAAEPYLGGIVTAALMDQWDFNYLAGMVSVQRGEFAELYARLGDSFTPAQAERVLADYARGAGVDVLTGARVVRVATAPGAAGRRVLSLVAADGHGRLHRFSADWFVDAGDDADVAALAGARYGIGRQDEGRDAKMQAATLLFSLQGLDWNAVLRSYDLRRYGYGRAIGARAWGYGHVARAYRPRSPRVAVRDLNLVRHPDGSVTVNAINVFDVDGRSARSVAEAVAVARAEAPLLAAYLRPRISGFAQARVAGFADALYVRETRHVRGLAMLRESDVWNRRVPADTIGISSYPLDTHPVDRADHATYAPERRAYGIPLGALLPLGFANLGLASRAISATHVAAGSARIVPTTVEEGEALGAACALARRRHVTLPQIDRDPALLRALRADLRAHDVLLDPPPTPASAARVGS